MYNWRRMTMGQKEDVLKNRITQNQPLHSPVHIKGQKKLFHISGACYEHRNIIGKDKGRLSSFQVLLNESVKDEAREIYACCILPNHYHVLLKTEDILILLKNIFRLHQKTGFEWNKEDLHKGRRVWCNATENAIKSERHFWATMNYIHHNPVKHGLVEKWKDWPYSTAVDFINNMGREKALAIWNNYDISRMGLTWDM